MSNDKLTPIEWWRMFKPIAGFQCGEGLSNRLKIEREALPIIFVPGTMASPLRTQGGEKSGMRMLAYSCCANTAW